MNSVKATDERYNMLSFQLFGNSSSGTSYRGPFVDLSRIRRIGNGFPKSFMPHVSSRASSGASGNRRRKKKIRGPLGRCLICYSSISRNDRLQMLGKQDELPTKVKKRSEDLLEFLGILASPVGILNKKLTGHTSTKAIFEKAIKRLSTRPWCLCITCDNACGQLLSRYREVKQLQAKFIAAIRISEALYDKDPNRELSLAKNDDDEDDESCCKSLKTQTRTKITLRMKTVNMTRMCLLGGKLGCRKSLLEYVNFDSMVKRNPEPLENIHITQTSLGIAISGMEDKIITNELDNTTVSNVILNQQIMTEHCGTIPIKSEHDEEENPVDYESDLDNVSEGLQDSISNNDVDTISIQSSTLGNVDVFNPTRSLTCEMKPTDPSDKLAEFNNTNTRIKSSQKQPSSRIKGLAHPRSFTHMPPAELSKKRSAVWHRQVRSRNPHMSVNELKKANLRKTGIIRKGRPGSIRRPISELKESQSNQGYIRFRKTYGQTMSLPAYKEMRRSVLSKEQNVVDGSTFPSRANKGSPGLMTCWRTKDGKVFFRGIEIKKNDSGLFVCHFCDRVYPARRSLTLHMNKQHIDLTDGHPCEYCDKKFYYPNELALHMQEKHNGGYQCDICGQKLANRSTLFHHKRVKHQRIKPHICEHCGKGFATTKDMTIHVRRHTGERPFICHICAQTFIDKQSMKLHIRRKHPDMTEPEQKLDFSRTNIRIKASGECFPDIQDSCEGSKE